MPHPEGTWNIWAAPVPVKVCEPATQATHAPAPSQTSPVPQGVLTGRLAAVSRHVELPVAQLVTPTLQTLGLVVQPASATQLTQLPALQT